MQHHYTTTGMEGGPLELVRYDTIRTPSLVYTRKNSTSSAAGPSRSFSVSCVYHAKDQKHQDHADRPSVTTICYRVGHHTYHLPANRNYSTYSTYEHEMRRNSKYISRQQAISLGYY